MGERVIAKYKKGKQSSRDSNDKKKVMVVVDEDKEPSVFCFKEIMAANQLHPYDILCNNQASVSIFHNKDLVFNIRKARCTWW